MGQRYVDILNRSILWFNYEPSRTPGENMRVGKLGNMYKLTLVRSSEYILTSEQMCLEFEVK